MLSHYPFSILNKIFLPIGRKLRKNENHIPWLYMLRKVNLASLLVAFYKQSCLNQTTQKHQRNQMAPLGLPHTTSAAVHQQLRTSVQKLPDFIKVFTHTHILIISLSYVDKQEKRAFQKHCLGNSHETQCIAAVPW